MTIQYADTRERSHRLWAPIVQVVGSNIRVGSGSTFRRLGESVSSLLDDYDYAVPSSDVEMFVQAHLVRNKISGEHEVLVDEIEMPIVSHGDAFAFKGSDYEPLCVVYDVRVPAGTTDVGALTINVYRTVQGDD